MVINLAPVTITPEAPVPMESSFFGADASNLTPESLMLYLETRLNGLDDQINGIFGKQNDIEKIRKALMKIQNELAALSEEGGDLKTGTTEYEKNIQTALEEIAAVDPDLANTLYADLQTQGQIMYGLDGKYLPAEVKATTEYMNNLVKQLESSAQMEMIRLQSLMSARGTAIQLSTNLISALGESTKAIAANIGR